MKELHQQLEKLSDELEDGVEDEELPEYQVDATKSMSLSDALLNACYQDNRDALFALLEADVSPDGEQDLDLETPLMIATAAMEGEVGARDFSCARSLLEAKADPDVICYGREPCETFLMTPLMMACVDGHEAAVEIAARGGSGRDRCQRRTAISIPRRR